MNIYLDIDGVLVANDNNAANHAAEFIEYILTNYPDRDMALASINESWRARWDSVGLRAG